MSDIYNDGTYLARHPALHEEDSEFKFEGLVEFLDFLQFRRREMRVVDIGGGAGKLGFLVADHLHKKGYEIEFVALDLSEQMLDLQKINNPYINKTINMSLTDCEEKGFDLALMMDIVEHIPEKHQAAEKVNSLSKYAIYNVPVEINLFDVLKNVYMRGRYYLLQKESLGHVHFFSYSSCRRFIKSHHHLIRHKFVGYCRHILSSNAPNHLRLRNNRLMALELQLSLWIWKYLRPLAPYLIQGTAFILVKTNAKTDH
jgi:SAM-dependent methyltransferase